MILQNTWRLLSGEPEGYGKERLHSFFSFLKYLFVYLFIWLHRVLVEAHGIFAAACGIFHCGVQALRCGTQSSLLLWRTGSRARGLSSCGAWALERAGLVAPWHVGS